LFLDRKPQKNFDLMSDEVSYCYSQVPLMLKRLFQRYIDINLLEIIKFQQKY